MSHFDSLSVRVLRVCVCVCVIRPARTTSWLIVPRSGPVVMRVTQYQTKETASLGDSSPLVEPVTAPSPHGRPLTDAHPPLPPCALLTAACFLQLACRPKHTLTPSCRAQSREAKNPGCLRQKPRPSELTTQRKRKRESGRS